MATLVDDGVEQEIGLADEQQAEAEHGSGAGGGGKARPVLVLIDGGQQQLQAPGQSEEAQDQRQEVADEEVDQAHGKGGTPR